MKKIISICCLTIALFLVGNLSVSAANYEYTLDLVITNPGLFPDVENMIGGVQFDVSGGVLDTDWTLEFGDAIPAGQVNWTYGNGKPWLDGDGISWSLVGVYDEYDWQTPVYGPMTSGRVLTIESDVELTFTSPEFFSFIGRGYDPGYFTTLGFVEQSSVPIPGGFFLLGSGLIGLVGFARRR